MFSDYFSCEEEDYYIKYESKITSKYIGGATTYVVNTESGSKTISSSSLSWSETFGPVKKGFNARIYGESNIYGTMTLTIHVCRGDDPFSIKATNSATGDYVNFGAPDCTKASVSYTIDF